MTKQKLQQKERQVKMQEKIEKEIIFQNDEKNLSPLGETVPTNKSMHVTKKNVLWTFFRQDGQSDREGIPYNENDVLEPSPVCKQTSSPRRGRLKAAFTLAEVMIALVILGVIAAVTVPSLMRKATESSNRTKVKKSIADFEKVVENMRITQGLKSVGETGSTDTTTLVGYVKGNDYQNGKSFFKIKSDGEEDYIFQTNDGVWWDIEDMSQPKISIDKDGSCLSSVGAAEGETCYNKSFYLTVSDGGTDKGNAFIVNDPSGAAKAALAFAKIIEPETTTEEDNPLLDMTRDELKEYYANKYTQPCSNDNCTYYYNGTKACSGLQNCYYSNHFNRSKVDGEYSWNIYRYYDENGNLVYAYDEVNRYPYPGYYPRNNYVAVYDKNNRIINDSYKNYDDGIYVYKYEYNGDEKIAYYCGSDGQNCSSSSCTYTNDDFFGILKYNENGLPWMCEE